MNEKNGVMHIPPGQHMHQTRTAPRGILHFVAELSSLDRCGCPYEGFYFVVKPDLEVQNPGTKVVTMFRALLLDPPPTPPPSPLATPPSTAMRVTTFVPAYNQKKAGYIINSVAMVFKNSTCTLFY